MKSKKQHGPCSVIGCGTTIYTKGMCNKHWQQMRNRGKIHRSRSEKNEYFIFNGVVLLKLDRKDESITYTVISLKDFEDCKEYKWHLDGRGYATTKVNGKHCKLHNFLMKPPDNNCGDHINHDPLDNRRCNLRLATQQQNSFNQKRRYDSKSGYKGVTWCPHLEKWRARIRHNGKEIYLGAFVYPEEAALAYNKAAKQYHGEFGVMNELPTTSWKRRRDFNIPAEMTSKPKKSPEAAA